MNDCEELRKEREELVALMADAVMKYAELKAENERLKLEVEIQIKTHEAQARTLRARYPELDPQPTERRG